MDRQSGQADTLYVGESKMLREFHVALKNNIVIVVFRSNYIFNFFFFFIRFPSGSIPNLSTIALADPEV